jgi:hypothetical protein
VTRIFDVTFLGSSRTSRSTMEFARQCPAHRQTIWKRLLKLPLFVLLAYQGAVILPHIHCRFTACLPTVMTDPIYAARAAWIKYCLPSAANETFDSMRAGVGGSNTDTACTRFSLASANFARPGPGGPQRIITFIEPSSQNHPRAKRRDSILSLSFLRSNGRDADGAQQQGKLLLNGSIRTPPERASRWQKLRRSVPDSGSQDRTITGPPIPFSPLRPPRTEVPLFENSFLEDQAWSRDFRHGPRLSVIPEKIQPPTSNFSPPEPLGAGNKNLSDLDPDKRHDAFFRIRANGWDNVVPKAWQVDMFSTTASNMNDDRSVYSQDNGEEASRWKDIALTPSDKHSPNAFLAGEMMPIRLRQTPVPSPRQTPRLPRFEMKASKDTEETQKPGLRWPLKNGSRSSLRDVSTSATLSVRSWLHFLKQSASHESRSSSLARLSFVETENDVHSSTESAFSPTKTFSGLSSRTLASPHPADVAAVAGPSELTYEVRQDYSAASLMPVRLSTRGQGATNRPQTEGAIAVEHLANDANHYVSPRSTWKKHIQEDGNLAPKEPNQTDQDVGSVIDHVKPRSRSSSWSTVGYSLASTPSSTLCLRNPAAEPSVPIESQGQDSSILPSEPLLSQEPPPTPPKGTDRVTFDVDEEIDEILDLYASPNRCPTIPPRSSSRLTPRSPTISRSTSLPGRTLYPQPATHGQKFSSIPSDAHHRGINSSPIIHSRKVSSTPSNGSPQAMCHTRNINTTSSTPHHSAGSIHHLIPPARPPRPHSHTMDLSQILLSEPLNPVSVRMPKSDRILSKYPLFYDGGSYSELGTRIVGGKGQRGSGNGREEWPDAKGRCQVDGVRGQAVLTGVDRWCGTWI